MRLLVILLVWLMRRQLDARQTWDLDAGLRKRLAAFSASHGSGLRYAAFLLLGLFTGLAFLLDHALSARDWYFPLFVFDAALLLVLCGLPGWREPLLAYGEAWRRGDMQAAWHHVRHLLPADRRGEALAPERLHTLLTRQLILKVFERYFLVIFYYILLGMAGVLLVRGLQLIRDAVPDGRARQRSATFLYGLEWVPVRLLSATFALAGDFSGWMGKGGRASLALGEATAQVLVRAADGALRELALDAMGIGIQHPARWPDYGARSLQATRSLLNRSLMVWIALLALITIVGYIP